MAKVPSWVRVAPTIALVGAGCGDLFHGTGWRSECDADEPPPECAGAGGRAADGGATAGTGTGGAPVGAASGSATSASSSAGSTGAATSGSGAGATTSGAGAGSSSAAGSGGGCVATPEICNFLDDDCDGACDDSAGCRAAVHRSYQPTTDEHFYSSDLAEAQCCGFILEVANYFYLYGVQLPGLAPFYRCALFNGKHLLTQDPNCEGAGNSEGVIGFIGPGPAPCGGDTPLYRLASGSGDHFFTVSLAEHDSAVAGGYGDEGIVGYVWMSP